MALKASLLLELSQHREDLEERFKRLEQGGQRENGEAI